MSERLVSRKSIEIAPAVLLSEDAQPLRPDHLDLVAPLIEVPRHFKPTRSMEADDEAAVVLRLGNLLWVEAELGGPARCRRRETPHDFAILIGKIGRASCRERVCQYG